VAQTLPLIEPTKEKQRRHHQSNLGVAGSMNKRTSAGPRFRRKKFGRDNTCSCREQALMLFAMKAKTP
jgi:hypothetical protein